MIETLSDNTKKAYEIAIGNFFKNNFKEYDSLKDLLPAEASDRIDSYFDGIEDYKPTTKLLKISALRSYVEKDLKISLPESEARKRLMKEIPKHSTKEDLTKDEVKIFVDFFLAYFNSADNNREKFIALRNFIVVCLLAYTGQRVGDILKMKVGMAKKEALHFKQEKSGQEVFIENPCINYINAYIALTILKDDDYLFANGLQREPISYRHILNVIQRAGLELFAKKITPHCFRKFVITELRLAGKSNAEIQSVSGHASSAMIDYYPTRQPKVTGLKSLLS